MKLWNTKSAGRHFPYLVEECAEVHGVLLALDLQIVRPGLISEIQQPNRQAKTRRRCAHYTTATPQTHPTFCLLPTPSKFSGERPSYVNRGGC